MFNTIGFLWPALILSRIVYSLVYFILYTSCLGNVVKIDERARHLHGNTIENWGLFVIEQAKRLRYY